MKKIKALFSVLLFLCLFMGFTLNALAEDTAEQTSYKVRIYAGEQGLIDGKDVLEETIIYGNRISFDPSVVTLPEDSKYYVKGIREAGMDNDMVANSSVEITRDMDFVVAYGISQNTVAYTVNYVDNTGNVLAPAKTFYGNAGDKPVVAYFYIEGYQPLYYNLTQTLDENAAKNVFTFEYNPLPAGVADDAAGVGIGAAAGGAGAANGAGAAQANAGQAVNGAGNPEEILDLDPPLAGPGAGAGNAGANGAGGGTDGIEGGHGLGIGGILGIIAGALAVAGIVVGIVIGSRKKANLRN